jgi:hypothetical protein
MLPQLKQPPDLKSWLQRLASNDTTLRGDVLATMFAGPIWTCLTQSTSFTYPSDRADLWRATRPLDHPSIWAGFRDHLLTHRIDSFDADAAEILLRAHAPLTWERWVELLPAMTDECRQAGKSGKVPGAWFVDILWEPGTLPAVATESDRRCQATLLYAFLVNLDGASRVRANLATAQDESLIAICKRILPATDIWWHRLDIIGVDDTMLTESLRAMKTPAESSCILPEELSP